MMSLHQQSGNNKHKSGVFWNWNATFASSKLWDLLHFHVTFKSSVTFHQTFPTFLAEL